MREPPMGHPEESLGAELRAAIDSLPTFSVPMPMRRPSRASAVGNVFRAGAMLAGSGLLIVLALAVGQTIAERRSALASPPPGDKIYGLIIQSGGPAVVRENDPTAPLAQLYQEPIHRGLADLGVAHATSPDGTRVAYWIWGPSPPGLGSLALTRLALYDGTTGTIRDVLSLPNESGGGVMWSTDGTGLLISVLSSGGSGQSGAQLAQLRTIDLATGTATSVGPTFSAQPASRPFAPSTPLPTPTPAGQIGLKPLLWDRTADRIVAAVAAPNPNYVSSIMVIDHGASSTTLAAGSTTLVAEEQFLSSTLAVSPDGTTIAGARTRDFALVTWPIADYAKRNEIVPAPGERILSLWWRPTTDQLYFLRDVSVTLPSGGNTATRLEVWRPGAGGPHVVNPTAGPSLLFRADGSAYLMVRPGSTAQVTYDVVDANNGRVLGQIANAQVAGTLLLPRGGRPAAAATPPTTVAPKATASMSLPICPPGQHPVLAIDFPPPPGDVPGTGADSAEEAFRRTFPTVTSFSMYAFGKAQPEAAPPGNPVWIVSGNDTYVAYILGDTNGRNNWFAYRARVAECRAPTGP